MKYDRDYIKQFIKEFHHVDLIPESEFDEEDDFFSLDKGSTMNMDDTVKVMQASDEVAYYVAYFNELLDRVDVLCTDREYFVFVLRCEGRTLERIGKVFELSRERIRQILMNVLDKICE
ncbi:sigma factor-like helix-turn-helix DNA-binding protein [Macrococcus carouselicus]|uniref:RNA polymerase subunit sigma-70 n=1 Tax=Macrococcus carouselicus TaxID=69969 RepID=A0A9Q8CK16_9STAP|nr:sigma factor-like helix-turn-helix DNA-binding protein [Macrococcus carouselicus]TDM03701.1 RNA polymerase subunit sigma-70 [Macrococcus carouselicus]